LQGSADGTAWETLRRHEGDNVLKGPMAEAAWSVEPVGEGHRHFRVLQTGPNADPPFPNILACAGIELYGTLCVE
jgi:hypothetical protein